MTPDTWQWGAGSGEIDSTEACPRDSLHLNFAGGGHQIGAGFSLDGSEGHVTVRKDDAGMVTIAACSRAEAAAGGGQCAAPQHASCDDCLAQDGFACWCNAPDNIYGSGGCQNGGDCMWTLVSDVWNGVSGDEGYSGCMCVVAPDGVAPSSLHPSPASPSLSLSDDDATTACHRSLGAIKSVRF